MGIGNLMGFGNPKLSAGGSLLGLGGSSGSKAPKKIIRNIDWKNNDLKRKAKDVGNVIRTHRVEKINGKNVVTREIIKKSNIVEFLKRGVKSGQTVSSYKYNFDKNRTMVDQKSGGKVKYIFSRDSALDRKKSDKIRDIYDKDGPTKQEMEFSDKKQARLSRIHVLETQRSREQEEGIASQLINRRKKEVKKSTDIRNIDNTKINAANIGAKGTQSTVSAQADKGSLDNSAQTGFANKIEHAEDKQGTAADLSKNKAKGIVNKPNDTPMFRPGADK
ncbi:hypothetical protein KAJ61_00450 [Candidatus Parcubacteria bacterium]|nr:hypothetical protein [Candidatus Parcubacteria bacterium]